MAVLKIETNVPQILSLAFSDGKEVESQFGGTQVMFSTVGGDRVYLPLPAAQKIKEAGITARRPFELVRKQVGKAIEWEVRTPNAAAMVTEVINAATPSHSMKQNSNSAQQLAPPSAYTPVPPAAEHRPVTLRMMAAMCAAIDAVIESEIYAERQGRGFTFSEDSIRAIAITIFIQDAREGGAQ